MTAMPIDALSHRSLLYESEEALVRGVLSFLEPALAADEPVLVALPHPRQALVCERLGERLGSLHTLDMVEVGRNPARLIPAYRELLGASGGRRMHLVAEPVWPGRSRAEIAEGLVHEALVNFAFANVPVRVLCPYDRAHLGDEAIAGAERTHPELVDGDEHRRSDTYAVPRVMDAPPGRPLFAPPADAAAVSFGRQDLARTRGLVAAHARAAGIGDRRREHLVLAVNELASNSVRHAGGAGELRMWRDDGTVICEVQDAGRIADPMVGRTRPGRESRGGHGLWLVNQLCDLVQLRSGDAGTTVRVHMAASSAIDGAAT